MRAANTPGMYADGGGLYLQVTRGEEGQARKSWLFRFATGEVRTSKSRRERRVERAMGLGSFTALLSTADIRK